MNPQVVDRMRVHRPQHVRLVGILAALAIVLGAAAPADAQRKKRKRRAKPAQEQPVKPAAEEPVAPGIDVAGAAAPAGSDAGADAAGKGKPTGSKKPKDQVFDFTGLALAGSMRMPQLLYFLDRAEEELERASLERRSFVPSLVKSIEEEAL